MTLEESREIIPLMESMIGQIEEQQNLMAKNEESKTDFGRSACGVDPYDVTAVKCSGG